MAKKKYQQEYDIAPAITFDGDHIALDIPDDGIQTDNGWEIVPVYKAHVSFINVSASGFNSLLFRQFCNGLEEGNNNDGFPF